MSQLVGGGTENHHAAKEGAKGGDLASLLSGRGWFNRTSSSTQHQSREAVKEHIMFGTQACRIALVKVIVGFAQASNDPAMITQDKSIVVAARYPTLVQIENDDQEIHNYICKKPKKRLRHPDRHSPEDFSAKLPVACLFENAERCG